MLCFCRLLCSCVNSKHDGDSEKNKESGLTTNQETWEHTIQKASKDIREQAMFEDVQDRSR